VGKVFLIALLLDAVYQLITVRWFYPGEALVTAIVLALVPYVLLRGPANRLWPRKSQQGTETQFHADGANPQPKETPHEQ